MSEPLKQRTTAWRRRRLGSATASRFKDVMTKPREKKNEWSETALTYLREKVTELRICAPVDTFTSKATRWGTDWEHEAFLAAVPLVEKMFGLPLCAPEGEFAYIEHPTEAYLGCSPDGTIGGPDDGLLELKCPYNPCVHTETVLDGYMPEKHKAQVQGCLWITGRKWYAFGSFDPRVRASGSDPLFMVKVDRDDDYINTELAPRVLKFRDLILDTYNKLCPNRAPF